MWQLIIKLRSVIRWAGMSYHCNDADRSTKQLTRFDSTHEQWPANATQTGCKLYAVKAQVTMPTLTISAKVCFNCASSLPNCTHEHFVMSFFVFYNLLISFWKSAKHFFKPASERLLFLGGCVFFVGGICFPPSVSRTSPERLPNVYFSHKFTVKHCCSKCKKSVTPSTMLTPKTHNIHWQCVI